MRLLVMGIAVWLCAIVCWAASPFDGKWTAQVGDNEKLTFTIATNEGKVTGSVTTEGAADAPIEWGMVKGDLITFKVKRVFQGSPQPFVYLGKIEGDKIAFGRRPENLTLGQLRELEAMRAK
jgi:hypothetical protein